MPQDPLLGTRPLRQVTLNSGPWVGGPLARMAEWEAASLNSGSSNEINWQEVQEQQKKFHFPELVELTATLHG